MPGASYPLDTQLLDRDAATGARTLLVRFPPGFERPGTGYYEVDEDFLLLHGELSINGQDFLRGDWVAVPGGTVRAATSSPSGALAVAWFSGRPEWQSASPDAPAGPLRHHRVQERPFAR